MPQATRPQIETVIRLPARKASPTSVTATAKASNLKFLVTRNATLAQNAAKAQVNAVIAMGTWKKMILKMMPWFLSSGSPMMALRSEEHTSELQSLRHLV